MNKKLILRHKINENPYGLYNSQLKPMSREETIEFFNEIDLTDEELLSLNDYILEDAGHSFFDNAYMVWNECGEHMNFIDGLRMSETCWNEDTSAEEAESHIITYEAHFEDQSWMATIDRIQLYHDYSDVVFKGRGSAIRAFVGRADELWICMPDQHVCTTLASSDDIFWNGEMLSSLMKNNIDGATLAYGIRCLCEEYFI